MNDPGNPGARTEKLRNFALTSLFAAIIFLMTFTPIGFINLVVIKATIVHIPVIIGSVLLGPKIGALLGAMFGAASLINNTIAPSLLSFVFSPLIPVPGTERGSFWAILICFGPRILVGVVPYYVDRFMCWVGRSDKKWRFVSLFTAGVAGGMTNTLLVMNLIYVLFQDAYAATRNVAPGAVYPMILSVIVLHGIPEAVVAGVFTSGVGKAMFAYLDRGKAKNNEGGTNQK
ncbi:ECF transporter S component [Synergistaceae bacterium OttesenSCG-928-I11]|nr:ECF transporter S component [Synergistaceae bacterium OttesenSCG-928-I11]